MVEDKIKSKIQSSETELLRSVLFFSDDDLDANRAGTLTADQMNRLENHIRSVRNKLIRRSIYSVIPLIYLLWNAANNPAPLEWTLVVVALLVLLGVIGFHREIMQNLRNDMNDGFVEQLQGLAVVNRTNNTITINEQDLQVPREVALRMRRLDPYAIFYLPRSKHILSAENLLEAEPPIHEQLENSDSQSDSPANRMLRDLHTRLGNFLDEPRD